VDQRLAEGVGSPMGLIDRVSTLIARSGFDVEGDGVVAEARRILAMESPLAPAGTIDLVIDNVTGLGPLAPLALDHGVTDILVNGPKEVWVDRAGNLELTDVTFESAGHLMATVERALAGLGLRVDRASPMVDARLGDGSRLHVAIPPASVDHPVVAIRRFAQTVATLDQLVEAGSLSDSRRKLLESSVVDKHSIIVSGGTGAGKTTLLNVLAGYVPATERIVTIEDAAELQFPGHVVRLEAHPPNAEGFGEVTTRELLRSALRLRPDRIIVGEVRGPEALELIGALNTGHRGSMSTVHANSPEEAMWRLETLALLDGIAAPEAVRRQLYAAVDLVVQVIRKGPMREVASIARVNGGDLEEMAGD
jgi:pilus assembly protein CpaF